MASVRKRPWTYKGVTKAAWVVDYTDQAGKRRTATAKPNSKKEADRLRLQIETEIEAGTHTPMRETATFAEACDEWVKDCERRHRIGDRMAGNTVYKNRSVAKNHLVPILGHLKLNTIDHSKLQEVVDGWSETHARSTVAEYASMLRLVFTMAVRKKWIKLSPLASLKLHVPGRMAKRLIPNRDEIEVILRALAVRYRQESVAGHRTRVLAVVLALFAGLRRGEVCGLQWEDVDFERGVIRIRHSLSRIDGLKDPKSKAGIRNVPMSPPVRSALSWAAGTEAALKGYVVATRNDTPVAPSNIYWYWLATMKQAGLVVAGSREGEVKPKYAFHSLRHAAVSLLIAEGLDAFHIKGFVGHHSIRTTMDIYGSLFPDDDTSRNAIESAAGGFTFAVASRKSLTGRPSVREIRANSPQTIEIIGAD